MKQFFFLLLSTFLVSGAPLFDYEFFPSVSQFPNLPVCINETILKRVDIPYSPRMILGNDTCLPADESCRPAFENCCGFYDCVESNCGCGAQGYPLGYGKKYCQIFSNYPFTGMGGKWRDATLRCLQRALIPFSKCPPTTCEILKTKAFDSHPFCYTSSGVCFLNPKDLLGILAITYGDVLTMDGVLQILETIKKCGLKYILQFEMEIVSKACQLKDDLRKLLLDLWRSNRYLPEWMLTSSVWEYKGKSGDDEVWKLKVFLLHTDDTLLPEQRYKDLVSVAETLVDFSNSEEYKNELQNATNDSIVSLKTTLEGDLNNNSGKTTFSAFICLLLILLVV
jgi:hypothetical protein